MNLLLTGASGLLGRALYAKLSRRNDLALTAVAYSRAAPPLVKADIRDPEAIERLFEAAKPDFVVHAAAERRPDVVDKDPRPGQGAQRGRHRSDGRGMRAAWRLPSLHLHGLRFRRHESALLPRIARASHQRIRRHEARGASAAWRRPLAAAMRLGRPSCGSPSSTDRSSGSRKARSASWPSSSSAANPAPSNIGRAAIPRTSTT